MEGGRMLSSPDSNPSSMGDDERPVGILEIAEPVVADLERDSVEAA
jgi:hypothetical protein